MYSHRNKQTCYILKQLAMLAEHHVKRGILVPCLCFQTMHCLFDEFDIRCKATASLKCNKHFITLCFARDLAFYSDYKGYFIITGWYDTLGVFWKLFTSFLLTK